jgi:glycosyltransferase involved in cell wall biosynthesis
VSRPPVSIVLLNYNQGPFLPVTLKALIAALGPDDEILAFDDCSTDNSVDIYQGFAERCPQIRLFVKAQNQGVIACMNEGLSEASMDYVYFAASDDQVEATFLDTMMTLLGTHPDAGLATCRTRIIDADGKDHGPLQTPIVLRQAGFLPPKQVAIAFMNDDNCLVGVSTIYRCAPLRAAGGFRAELGSFCDGFASRAVAMRHGACYSPAVLTNWRRMEEGYSSSQSTDLTAVQNIANIALKLMEAEYADAFQAAYATRWKGRWLFGARYYAWCRRQNARHPNGGTGWFGKPMLAAARIATGLILFLRYRPRDLWAVIKRRLAYGLGKGNPT